MGINLEHLKYCYDESLMAFAAIEVIKDENDEPINFVFKYANKACAELDKLPLDAIIGKTFYELYEVTDRKWLKIYAETAFGGKTQRVTEYSPEIDRYLRILCHQIIPGVCGCILIDVTDEILANTALEESRKKLKTAVNHAKLQYWEYDMNTDTAYISDYSKNMYALPSEIKNFPESFLQTGIVHPDSVEPYRQMHMDLKNGTKDIVREFKLRPNINSPYVWTKVHYTTIFDKGGKPLKAIATASSTEDYKQLEEEFSASMSQLGASVWRYDFKEKKFIKKIILPINLV